MAVNEVSNVGSQQSITLKLESLYSCKSSSLTKPNRGTVWLVGEKVITDHVNQNGSLIQALLHYPNESQKYQDIYSQTCSLQADLR